jgi:hypothetical protein
MKLVLAAVAALSLSGCALINQVNTPLPDIVMAGDTQFNAQERQCIQDSFTIWHDQSNGVVNLSVVWNLDGASKASVAAHYLDDRIVRWQSTEQRLKDEDAYYAKLTGRTDYTLMGQTSVDGGIHSIRNVPVEVRLVTDRFNNDPHVCRLVTLHELGHFMGLGHDASDHANIMYPDVENNRTDCLKSSDLNQLCKFNDCLGRDMKPCPG